MLCLFQFAIRSNWDGPEMITLASPVIIETRFRSFIRHIIGIASAIGAMCLSNFSAAVADEIPNPLANLGESGAD